MCDPVYRALLQELGENKTPGGLFNGEKQEEKKVWTAFFQAMKENFYEFKPQGETFLVHPPLTARK